MQAQPDVFPELLVATVASAEGSGLPQALRRYQHYELRIENIRKKVVARCCIRRRWSRSALAS